MAYHTLVRPGRCLKKTQLSIDHPARGGEKRVPVKIRLGKQGALPGGRGRRQWILRGRSMIVGPAPLIGNSVWRKKRSKSSIGKTEHGIGGGTFGHITA